MNGNRGSHHKQEQRLRQQHQALGFVCFDDEWSPSTHRGQAARPGRLP